MTPAKLEAAFSELWTDIVDEGGTRSTIVREALARLITRIRVVAEAVSGRYGLEVQGDLAAFLGLIDQGGGKNA